MADNNDADLPGVTSGIITDFEIEVFDKKVMFNELSVTDVYIHESLLSPTVQISATFHDTIHLIKNYFQYKIKEGEMPNVRMTVRNPQFNIDNSGKPHGVTRDSELTLNNFRVFRMDNRRPINYHVEQYTLHMVSPSIVRNLTYRMSDFYKMKELSKIVEKAMNAVGIREYSRFIEKTDLKRDYMTNNQHPFQVIAEIADMAMKDTNMKEKYAQYLHYMTTEEVQGKHYFISLTELLKRAQDPKGKVDFKFIYNEKGANETFDIHDIMTYEFPCDFDTLLDLSGGIIHNREDYDNHKPSMMSINPFDGGIFLVDGKFHKGGDKKDKKSKKVQAPQSVGGTLHTGAWSNLNNFEGAETVPSLLGLGGVGYKGVADRPSGVEKYMHTRTEPITMLHREKIDLKIVVPFNPLMHVGHLIDVSFFTKREYGGTKNLDFGTGIYLVCHMTHNVKIGSYSTTTLECVKVRDKSSFYNEMRPDHQILRKLVEKKKPKNGKK